jgi:hypothetical protein
MPAATAFSRNTRRRSQAQAHPAAAVIGSSVTL